MSMIIRPMKKEEIKYSYPQSCQIRYQTGYIGHQNAKPSDVPLIGTIFVDYPKGFDTDLNEVIELLQDNKIFAEMFEKKSSIRQFIKNNPIYRIDENECGITVETNDCIYLIRFASLEDDIVCFYCYNRSSLEIHINNAKRGIRFITSGYKNLFVIEDGGKILFERSGDEPKEMVCRYIDNYHVEINGNMYHICQFAELCEKIGIKCTPIERNENMKGELT